MVQNILPFCKLPQYECTLLLSDRILCHFLCFYISWLWHIVFSARCTPRVTMNAMVCYASLHHKYSYRLNDKLDGWKQNILEFSVTNVHILESWGNKSTSSCSCTPKTNQISTAGLQSLDPYCTLMLVCHQSLSDILLYLYCHIIMNFLELIQLKSVSFKKHTPSVPL
jgi:hypothetical protein